MKYLVITLLAISSLGAQAQKKSYAPVYDHSGTVTRWLASYDTISSMTVQGDTTSVGCNFHEGGSVDCSDTMGGYTVVLADGSTTPLATTAYVFKTGKGLKEDYWPNALTAVSPMLEQMTHGGGSVKSVRFNYRLISIRGHSYSYPMPGDYFCVASPKPPKHDQYEELCSRMDFVEKAK